MNVYLKRELSVMFRLLLLILFLSYLPGCGSNDSPLHEENEEVGVGVGGTGTGASSVTTGAIKMLGNVISVGGVEIDISAARIENGFGDPLRVSDLQLGMWVHVTAGSFGEAAPLVGERVVVQAEVVGKITNINKPRRNFYVLGRLIQADDRTVLGGFSTFDELNIGDTVEVYGPSVSRKILATRVSRSDVMTRMTLGGVITGLTPETFAIDQVIVDYSTAAIVVNGGLKSGLSVLVEGPGVLANGTFKATRVVDTTSPAVKTSSVQIIGVISEFEGTSQVRVGAMVVDATRAQFFDGAVVDLKVGNYVRVQGNVRNGTLIANRIQFRGSFDPDVLTFTRTITELRSLSEVVAEDVTIDASAAVFRTGVAQQLQMHKKIRVRGRLRENIFVAEEIWILD